MTADAPDERMVIADGERVGAFLADPSVQAAIRRLEQTYFHEFEEAHSEEARLTCWAKCRVLRDLASSLVAVRDGGVLEAERRRKEAQRAAYARVALG